jgi:alkylation response protein AidB-like acyl-CoA dehydrogenase
VDLELSEEQKLIVATVRRFVREEIVPLEANLDPDASELPPEDFARLSAKVKQMGYWGLDIPAEYGGPGIDLTTRVLMAIEMAQHRAGLYAPCYGVFGGAGLAQLYEANDDQKQRYLYPLLRGEKRGFFGLTEPSGGSDPARAIRTRAVRDGDDWVINGSKVFISGADKADFGLVFARTDAAKGRNGVTCFIVDTDMKGFRVERTDTGGREATFSHRYPWKSLAL